MGEVFAGRYELVDPIGRGGVGAVWRAWDHRRRRYVAAKVLLQSDAHSLLRFVREQALRIDHPHVLAPTSWAADDDKVLFTMDLVAGGSLVHLVGDYGPLPPAFVCTLLDQLLSGLAAVHAEDVVHRDVKPANVLLEPTGTGRPRLRLSDFGIAMRLGEPRLTETNLVVGTPGYLAPEQMMGAEPDFPADLFAAGLVALYLLEGAKPDSKALIQYFAEHGTPGAPKGIPEPLWQVVATLLQPDPRLRFRTATGARKALAAAAELLPEPGPDDELIEIFDQLGPLPQGFAPEGPLERARGLGPRGEPAGAGTDGGRLGQRLDHRDQRADPRAGEEQHREDAQVSSGSTPSPRSSDGTDGTGDAWSTPSAPAQPPSMSDTGSFHLPPPQATVTPSTSPGGPRHTHPLPPSQPLPPAYPGPAGPTSHLNHPSRPLPPAAQQPTGTSTGTSTASYTAQSPQTPPPGQAPSRHRAPRRPRRPGPSAQVAIPLLLLALVCYAVGFWALSRL
ncbi:serine/threonine protein kinase [Streptomyces viridochromogenes DSM 40736]|uniref:non-specific serine/threonine protein kinase n=1 Tax=Streptomyces viridochromogenes (strain DSM 40736 / JCM 4977 / BCRC 1201 / Tue 494) TaxID=591159 RepID=D9X061_STRVT|nr:serine/threonine-protein kinase [Streptomyces viridochromogenes]EFL33419.1 serine/threonine protein kinase [Streptomyces viridochromogenes DSM 40736]